MIPVVVACAAATGCLGGTYNPSYFPYYLPPGDVIQTHAKPAGLGYFANFDPKAIRLDLTPASCTLPTKTRHVLVATVVDKDGQPRRKRRVEWMIEGAGNIIEVDESGYLPGRGYKVDNKYAVSYTDFFEHKIARGSSDPRDDVTIGPGQTWCVVSSALEGVTTVTALAPEVYDKDRGTVTVKLTWADGAPGLPAPGPGFPAPTVSRSGDERTHATKLVHAGAKDEPLTFDVRAPKATAIGRETPIAFELANAAATATQPATLTATIPDGTEFVRGEPPPSSQQGRTFTWAAVAVPAGQTLTVTATVRPTKRGTFTVDAAVETADGYHAKHAAAIAADTAGLKVTAELPAQVGLQAPVSLDVAVANSGAVEADNVTVWVTLDASLAPASGASPVEVPVGSVPAGQTKHVQVPLTAKQLGHAVAKVNATADGGLTDKTEAATEVRKAATLAVAVSGPDQLALNLDGTWQVTVTNTGDVPATDVVARVTLPASVAGRTATDGGKLAGTDGAEWQIGTLAPNEKKAVRVTATADKVAPKASVAASVVAGVPGARTQAKGETSLTVIGQPALLLELADHPAAIPVGQKATIRITVRNRGTGTAKKLEVTATGADALKIVGGTGADRKPGTVNGATVTFTLDELPPGAAAVFVANLEAVAPGTARLQVDVRGDHLAQPLHEEQAARVTGGN